MLSTFQPARMLRANALAPRWVRGYWIVAVTLLVALLSTSARADKPEGVTAQTLKLPSGPSALKGLGESFSPNISTGTGNFSVPIQVAPGFLAPSVTISYTGGKGKGVAGQSFDVPVLQIYRTRDKGAPNFDEDDRFAVSGPGLNDELVLVNAKDRYYRLKNEGAYALFIRNQANNTWTIRFPSGQTATLGASIESREASRGRVYRWFISKQEDRFSHATEYDYFRDGGRVYLDAIRYQMHAAETLQNRIQFDYDDRRDVFTDYSYGDEVTTSLRLSGVTVWHGSRPIRTYSLGYKDGLHSSLLETVQMVGEFGTPMPPLTFSYLEATYEAGLLVPMLSTPPIESLVDGSGTFEDMNADGLPDLLVGHAGKYHYYENLDGWNFGSRRLVNGSPDRTLGLDDALLADINGDGFRDLVHRQGDRFRYYPGGNIERGIFKGYREAVELDTRSTGFSFTDEIVKMTDLNSDGRIDLLWQKPGQDAALINDEDDVIREERIPDLPIDVNFDDPRVQLTDFNGDGELDFVLVDIKQESSRVRVWFGLGHGEYSPEMQMTGVPNGDASEYHVRDVDHDGQADLVRVSGSWAAYYLNLGNLRYSGRRGNVSGLPPAALTQRLLFADMNGNGTEDIVFVTTDFKLRYLDLMKQPNAGLLSRVDNGMGLVTDIEYRMSTEYAMEAREASEPWVHPMPLQVPVIAEIRTSDSMDELGLHETETRTTYHYRDGYYDGEEREFRGFGIVTVTNWGDAEHGTLVTETRMHVGRNPKTGADEEILKGRPFVALTRDDQGALFSAVETAYEQRWLCQQDVGGGLRVLPDCDSSKDLSEDKDEMVAIGVSTETLTATYERTSSPRFTGSRTFYNAWGQVSESHTLGEVAYLGSYQPGDGVDLSAVDASLGDDEAITLSEYINDTNKWLIGLPKETELTDFDGNSYSRTLTYYDGPAFVGLSLGRAEKGLASRATQYYPEEDRWIAVLRAKYNDHGKLEARQNAVGDFVELDYDRETGFFPERERVEVDDAWLEFSVVNDTGLGLALTSTDPNGGTRRFEFDDLGRLTTEWGPLHKNATRRFRYDYGNPISTTEVETLQDDAGVGTYGYSVAFSDGTGDSRQTKTLAEHTHGYISSGWVRKSSRGTPVELYQSFPTRTTDVEAPPEAWPSTLSVLDPLGRATKVLPPDTDELEGTQILTSYRPFESRTYSEKESTQGDLQHPVITRIDGLGRPVSVEKYNQVGGELKQLMWRVSYNPRGQIETFTDPKWDPDGTEWNDRRHRRHYSYDGLGRMTALQDPNLGSMEYRHDDLGRLVKSTNSLGNIQRWVYGTAGRLLRHETTTSEQASATVYAFHYDKPAPGTPLSEPDAANLLGRLAWVEHPLGAEHYAYDALGHPTEETHTLWDPDASTFAEQVRDTFREEFEYRADGLPKGIRGPSGLVVNHSYNVRGLLTGASMGIGGDVRQVLAEARYDHRGLAVETLAGNDVQICRAVDVRGGVIGVLAAALGEGRVDCGSGRTVTGNEAGSFSAQHPSEGGAGLGFHHLHYQRGFDGLIESIGDYSRTKGDSGKVLPIPRLDATYAYDAIHQLTGATDVEGNTIKYHYDEIQNVIQREIQGPNTPRGPPMGLSVGKFEYGEDAAGPNAVTSFVKEIGFENGERVFEETPSEEYEYDAAGQMKSYRGYALEWNAEGKLVSADNGAKRFVYFYDAWGERRIILSYDLSGSDTKRTVHRFVFPIYQERDGEQVFLAGAGGTKVEVVRSKGVKMDLTLLDQLEQYASGESPDLRPLPAEYLDLNEDGFVLHPDLDEAAKEAELELAREAAVNGKRIGGGQLVWRFYTTDHLGGITHASDSAGELVSHERYHPYGKTRDRFGVRSYQGYIGVDREPDEDLGLIRMGARYYAPDLGRWVSADPLIGQDPQSMAERVLESNLYSYAANDPTNSLDSAGTQTMAPPPLTGPAPPGKEFFQKIGNATHIAIAEHYAAANPNDNVYTNTRKIIGIVRELGGDEAGVYRRSAHDPSNKDLGRLQPDIYNATTGEVYEIKSRAGLKFAKGTMETYVRILNRARLDARPGRSNAPGTSGHIPCWRGYVVFYSPMPGTIVSRYVPATVPLPVADLEKVEQQLRKEVHDILHPAPTAADVAMALYPLALPAAVAAGPALLTGAAAAAPAEATVSAPFWGPALAAAAALLWTGGGDDDNVGGGSDTSASASEAKAE